MEWVQLSIIAGFPPRSLFHKESIDSCPWVFLCVLQRGKLREVDLTYICSPSCYGWAEIPVDIHRRCHPSAFPCRYAHSRDSCPCRWVPPLSLPVVLFTDTERQQVTSSCIIEIPQDGLEVRYHKCVTLWDCLKWTLIFNFWWMTDWVRFNDDSSTCWNMLVCSGHRKRRLTTEGIKPSAVADPLDL